MPDGLTIDLRLASHRAFRGVRARDRFPGDSRRRPHRFADDAKPKARNDARGHFVRLKFSNGVVRDIAMASKDDVTRFMWARTVVYGVDSVSGGFNP